MNITKKVVDKVDEVTELDYAKDNVLTAFGKGALSVVPGIIMSYGVVLFGMVVYANITGKQIGFIDKE